MIYDINGEHSITYDLSGDILNTAYDIYGNLEPLGVLLDENFNSFDTNVWSCLSGNYRDWQYLPEDYSNNAFTQDGKLIVRNLKNNPAPGYEWSGAFVQSKNKFQFQYGTLFSRIKFPSDGNYYHATLWMLGNNAGEIDIAEADSGNVSAAVHYYDLQGNLHSKLIGFYPVVASEYHTYRMDWTQRKISFSCDGALLGSFNVDDATIDGYNSFRQPLYLVFNTNPYSTANQLYSTYDSVTNYVDFIKVYGFAT